MYIALIIILCSALVLSPNYSGGDQPKNTKEALAFLQNPGTTFSAAKYLYEHAKSDSGVRSVLLTELPHLIDSAQNQEVFESETGLAGRLKIESAVPILVKILERGDASGVVTLSRMMHLRNDPAGSALVQIGDPAVEGVKTLLRSQNVAVRRRAILVLINIDSETAHRSLQMHMPHEGDESLIKLMQSHMGK